MTITDTATDTTPETITTTTRSPASFIGAFERSVLRVLAPRVWLSVEVLQRCVALEHDGSRVGTQRIIGALDRLAEAGKADVRGVAPAREWRSFQ